MWPRITALVAAIGQIFRARRQHELTCNHDNKVLQEWKGTGPVHLSTCLDEELQQTWLLVLCELYQSTQEWVITAAISSPPFINQQWKMRDKYSEISENCGLNETSQRHTSYKYQAINSSFAVQFIPLYTPTTHFACGILTEHVALFALRITLYHGCTVYPKI
jgi:hypothetical protein